MFASAASFSTPPPTHTLLTAPTRVWGYKHCMEVSILFGFWSGGGGMQQQPPLNPRTLKTEHAVNPYLSASLLLLASAASLSTASTTSM
jgi:hypothetical protein